MAAGLLVTTAVVALVVQEIGTSGWQARLATGYVARLGFSVEPKPSSRPLRAPSGPLDVRRGYARLPEFTARLTAAGMRITRQAHPNAALVRLSEWSIAPPYAAPPGAALTLRGAHGRVLFDAGREVERFVDFDEVPPLLVQTLAYIENRELFDDDPRRNPAIEWDRQTKAAVSYAAARLGLPVDVEGGSTLATQLEKFRHSPQGRTRSPTDKLRQIVGATLRAYRYGADTTRSRREILVDYLNAMPLAAAPMWGEVHGLGDGLRSWFGMSLREVCRALASTDDAAARARAYKHVVALLAALRAPHRLLVEDRLALERRIGLYLDLLADDGIIDAGFAEDVRRTPLAFLPYAPVPPRPDFVDRKAVTAVRIRLLELLGLDSLYELDRLHLEVESTVDATLQNEGIRLLENLGKQAFVEAGGLTGERLLGDADPGGVVYSLLLLERAPEGNMLRMQVDNLDQPFDINRGVKLELGSTAKLRTLAHYLEVVALLFRELGGLPAPALLEQARVARDPVTAWVAATLARHRPIELRELLDAALARRYPARPEAFFTGGGVHHFVNFDAGDNGRHPTVLDALRESINLVFIRLMRDLAGYHAARLPYDAHEALHEHDSALRARQLQEVAGEEARETLWRAYGKYHGQNSIDIVRRLLGPKAGSPRYLAVLFYAWKAGKSETELAAWLARHLGRDVDASMLRSLMRSYGNPDLSIADYGYLASRDSLELWAAGRLAHEPALSWEALLAQSADARRVTTAWLFKSANRAAQDRRLRIRIERDAFVRMTPYWQRLGFPFARLVPSYATAIGSSGDRPAALADLMGIIVNDGVRKSGLLLRRLRFAAGTPYETVFEPAVARPQRVMEEPVAHALRDALRQVVEGGTGRRVAGALRHRDGTPARVGGKTGTGDNRFGTFAPGGGLPRPRVPNRTGTFAFYVDDRYFGVVTAFVAGADARAYGYTSALPVSVLKLFAPALNARLASAPPAHPRPLSGEDHS